MLIELGGRTLDATDRCLVMGILNVATDSPVSDSVVDIGDAPRRADALRQAGAAMIDVGAQSTRTGAAEVSADQEIARVVPVIEALVAEGHLVSVDTWTAAVARAAVAAGAHLINDITGADPETVEVAVETHTPIAVMHMRDDRSAIAKWLTNTRMSRPRCATISAAAPPKSRLRVRPRSGSTPASSSVGA